VVKLTNYSKFKNINVNGIIAFQVKQNDELFDIRLVKPEMEIILGCSNGKACRFDLSSIREQGRNSIGVLGMKVPLGHEIVGVATIDTQIEHKILSIRDDGKGKLTSYKAYRKTHRNSMGVTSIKLEQGQMMRGFLEVSDTDDLIVMTQNGTTLRTTINSISTQSRATKGVNIIKINEDDKISSIAALPSLEEIIEPTLDTEIETIKKEVE
jgi:DNA gyrase subunit A